MFQYSRLFSAECLLTILAAGRREPFSLTKLYQGGEVTRPFEICCCINLMHWPSVFHAIRMSSSSSLSCEWKRPEQGGADALCIWLLMIQCLNNRHVISRKMEEWSQLTLTLTADPGNWSKVDRNRQRRQISSLIRPQFFKSWWWGIGLAMKKAENINEA